MKCPYCNKEMTAGYLYGDRYPSQWLPESEKLFLGIWTRNGEPVGKRKRGQRQRIHAHKCTACRKMVIDLEDPQN